jgi:ATP-binding cassette, subfamily C (CFTR/MRP), member 1
MKKINGQIEIKGNISYCQQQSWIQNATVKENILFGKEFDQDKFYNIIKLCELENDLNFMNNGIDTVIGEKGFNLFLL